jgi:hypothetical protein
MPIIEIYYESDDRERLARVTQGAECEWFVEFYRYLAGRVPRTRVAKSLTSAQGIARKWVAPPRARKEQP